MRTVYFGVYIHCVWATWDRLPLITPNVEAALYAAVLDKAMEHQCQPIAIGGVEDHVHVLLKLHQTAAAADLLQGMKGASSHLATHVIAPGQFFKWQGGYGAFSVCRAELQTVRRYVENQKRLHAQGRTLVEFEKWAEIQGPIPGD
jgi:REP element-mobilizing transposase RayT